MTVQSKWLNQTQADDLLDRAMELLPAYGVGFVRLEPGRLPSLLGSGTLVEIDGLCAVLTADHVLTVLPTSGELGLVIGGPAAPGENRLRFDAGLSWQIRIGPASGNGHGPDLALLTLPPATIGALKARASFYNVTKRAARILRSPRPVAAGGWIIMGIVDEWTTAGPSTRGFQGVQNFTTVCGGAYVSRQTKRRGFDYLHFEVQPGNPIVNRPHSYEGVSGGSLWQLVVTLDDGIVRIKEPLLSGVPFYQTDPGRDQTIVCHGRRSIYDVVVKAARWFMANRQSGDRLRSASDGHGRLAIPRELIDTGRGKRFLRRDRNGRVDDVVNVGKSQDRKREAKRTVRAGEGDRGDQKPRAAGGPRKKASTAKRSAAKTGTGRSTEKARPKRSTTKARSRAATKARPRSNAKATKNPAVVAERKVSPLCDGNG